MVTEVTEAERKFRRRWIPNIGIVSLATLFGVGLGIIVDVVYFLSHWTMLPVLAMGLGTIPGLLIGAMIVAIRVRNEIVDP